MRAPCLRNNWLHLNTLDTVTCVRRLTSFYVAEHNTAIPHSAFQGETPDEMYFGTHTGVAANLVQQRGRARHDRLATNRALTCTDCAVAVDDQPSEPRRTSYGATTGRTGSRVIPPMSQMRAGRSGMS